MVAEMIEIFAIKTKWALQEKAKVVFKLILYMKHKYERNEGQLVSIFCRQLALKFKLEHFIYKLKLHGNQLNVTTGLRTVKILCCCQKLTLRGLEDKKKSCMWKKRGSKCTYTQWFNKVGVSIKGANMCTLSLKTPASFLSLIHLHTTNISGMIHHFYNVWFVVIFTKWPIW